MKIELNSKFCIGDIVKVCNKTIQSTQKHRIIKIMIDVRVNEHKNIQYKYRYIIKPIDNRLIYRNNIVLEEELEKAS